MKFQWGTVIGVVLAVAVGGLVSTYVVGTVTFITDGSAKLIARLQEMALLALVIERAVEVYLRVANQNGPDRNDPDSSAAPDQSASQLATFVAFIVGVLVAILGVRLMGSFVSFSSSTWLPNTLWNGVDVLISGALLAGGAVFIHEIVETLVGGVRTINAKISPAGVENAGGPVTTRNTAPPAAKEILPTSAFTITVERTAVDSGTLNFSGGGVVIDTTCWWDKNVKIAAANYVGCSKTRMDSKRDSVTGEKRPGIYLPQAVVPGTSNHSIFIHEGKDPSWSDGCIVIDRGEMLKLWDAITPNDGRNVSVNVSG